MTATFIKGSYERMNDEKQSQVAVPDCVLLESILVQEYSI